MEANRGKQGKRKWKRKTQTLRAYTHETVQMGKLLEKRVNELEGNNEELLRYIQEREGVTHPTREENRFFARKPFRNEAGQNTPFDPKMTKLGWNVY